MTLPLVLVENEATTGGQYDHWQDTTGEQYHYPNQYRNRVVSGRRFVYYRGVRRADGQRGQPEYFGTGRIGDVWRDEAIAETVPKRRWRWYCAIQDFLPFPDPVPAKISGKYFEQISHPRDWGTGVREIDNSILAQILAVAGLESAVYDLDDETSVVPMPLAAVPISHVSPIESVGLMPSRDLRTANRMPGPSRSPFRRTRRAKEIGDRAEEIVLHWLRARLHVDARESVKWLSKSGITPGWDIEFLDELGEMIAVEVKGTTATSFQSIEITAQEWNEASRKGERYWLVLVAECLSEQPKIEVIKNPCALLGDGSWQIEPVLWRLSAGCRG